MLTVDLQDTDSNPVVSAMRAGPTSFFEAREGSPHYVRCFLVAETAP